ncbi:MAG TPA: hypothetical protein VGL61_27360 [Kofleriaceae bacterium]|jgi:tetratricopeptide (TPR) repeat protein
MKHVACLLVVAVAACNACNSPSPSEHAPPPRVTQTAEPSDAIDQKLMVALSQAKNLTHKARIYTSDGDAASAIAAVREILALHFPANSPEAEDVRNDARAMLARLLVGQGNLDEAMNVIAEGLAQSQRESFFVANLYTVKGEILEARATALDTDPANKAHVVELRHAAIEAYDESNKIDKKLQDQLTESR